VPEAFARDVLLPAVRASTSLRELRTAYPPHVWDSTREAEDFVKRRAADNA
jgi:hypothetical protein